MKNSLRLQSTLMLILHIFLFFLLLWTVTVPLDQLHPNADDQTGESGDRFAFQVNLSQSETLIWSAAAVTALLGVVIPWLISRRVLNPIFSIRDTIRQVIRGDMEARVQVRAGKEFEALAFEFNRMTDFQKQDKERLTGFNRTLSAICACRHEMIRETDEKRLIQKCCQILADTGEYRIAWIGYADESASGTLTPAARAGYPNESLNMVSESWTGTAFSPATRAIRNRRSAIVRDIFDDPLLASLQEEAARHGFASIISLPLSVEQRTIGALTLHAGKPDAFGTEEIRLLTELADDLACCMHAIRYTVKQKARRRPLS
jgi:HAMP domain-containing protein